MEPFDIEPDAVLLFFIIFFFFAVVLIWSLELIAPLDIEPEDAGAADIEPLDMEPEDAGAEDIEPLSVDCAPAAPATAALRTKARPAIFA